MATVFDMEAFRRKRAIVSEYEDIRTLFQEELFDWIDCYNETLASENDEIAKETARKSIANLWLEYINFEKSLKQFKKVGQLFEDAIKEPITSKTGILFGEYANYFKERGKKANVQKIYIRGLCVVGMERSETDELWWQFLSFMHQENKSTNLTVIELFDAVKSQMSNVEDKLIPPSDNFSSQYGGIQSLEDAPVQTFISPAESKEQDIIEPALMPYFQSSSTSAIEFSDNEIEKLDDAMIDSDDLDDLSGLTPELLLRVFSRRTPALFSAPDKEPMLSASSQLSIQEIAEIESFLGTPISSLGRESFSKADIALDILEGLWITQALKERYFDAWFSDLKMTQSQEVRIPAFLD